MIVKNWMSKPVITVEENSSMQDAVNLLKEHPIRMLPVIKKGNLVGILTDRDIKRHSASEATGLDIHELNYIISRIKVKDIMTTPAIVVLTDFTVEETAKVLLDNKISGVPVMTPGNNIAGVITQTDIFKVLISLTGIKLGGVQYAFRVPDRPGSIKELTDIVRQYGGRLSSILMSYEKGHEGHRNVYIRARNVDPRKVDDLNERLRMKAHLLYMVDNDRDIRMFS